MIIQDRKKSWETGGEQPSAKGAIREHAPEILKISLSENVFFWVLKTNQSV